MKENDTDQVRPDKIAFGTAGGVAYRTLIAAMAAALIISGSAGAGQTKKTGPAEDLKADETTYILSVENTMGRSALSRALGAEKNLGTRRFKTLSQFTGRHYYLMKKDPETRGLENLDAGHPGIRVFPNVYRRLENTLPDDGEFGAQWCHSNPESPGTDMASDTAWDITTGSKEAVVAVLDSGVDYTHPDLAPNIWKNRNEIPDNKIDDDGNGYVDDIFGIDTGDNDSDPMDYDGHGTHCAGIIGAVGDNNIGVAGVNWDCSIMAVKGFEEASDLMSTAMELEAIDYLLYMKTYENVNLVAVNASFGYRGKPDTLEQEAIEALGRAGILFMAAAGNKSRNNDLGGDVSHYPSSYPLDNIIAVAATDREGKLAWFSNFGHKRVDIAAPGQDILSTVQHSISYEPDRDTALFYDDLETGEANFTMEGTWAVTRENSISPFYALSDSPEGRYGADTDDAVTSRAIDLSGTNTELALGFYALHDIEEAGTAFFDALETWFLAPGTPGRPAGDPIVPQKWAVTSDRAAGGSFAWTDSPDGEYPNDCEQWLLSPVVDLSREDGSCEFRFKLSGAMEEKHDGLSLYFSRDSGRTWSEKIITIDGERPSWEPVSVSIPQTYLVSQFRAAFILFSDKSITKDGYYIDDIEISGAGGPVFFDDVENGAGLWREPGSEAVAPTPAKWEKIGAFAGSSKGRWKLYNYKIPQRFFWEGFQFKFVLSSDWGTQKDGAYIDNIAIGVPENKYSYEYLSGTSMATPQVTGAAALIASAFPGLDASGIKQRILNGAVPLESLAAKVSTGASLNLFGALSDIDRDSDHDRVPDYLDNCRTTPNPGQKDTDLDGFGNRCDCDLNNDNRVDRSDFKIFRKAWGSRGPDADFNGTGQVDRADYKIFRSRWGAAAPFE